MQMEYNSNNQPDTIQIAKEVRSCVGELRMTGKDKPKKRVEGYALKWGVRYSVSWFDEVIQEGALNEANMSDVRILFNHDPNMIIGRTSAGTAEVRLDNTGLFFSAEIPDSPFGQNLIASLERGDITQASWAFDINYNGDKWTYDQINNRDVRTITNVRNVYDASPVTYPANPDTSVAARSLDAVKSKKPLVSGTNTPTKTGKRDGMNEGQMPPQAQAIEAITGAIECLNESSGELKEYADKMTMIGSVNADLKPLCDSLASMLTVRSDENTALVNELAGAIIQVNTGAQSERSGLDETYNKLRRAIDRLEAIHN